MNRREFLGGLAAAAVMPTAASERTSKAEYHAFSRVFQFLKDPYRAADFLKACGYDGIEWTVRNGGFLDPTAATADKMKSLKSAADKAGIKAENIVVDYLRGDDPDAERVILLAADAGFKSFRGEYFKYDRTKTYRQNFDVFRSGFDSLEALAKKSGLKACYQNHSTYNKSVPLFGSLVWDLASVIREHDPKYVGIQYDPMHVRAEGGPSWDHSFGAIAPWIDIVCLKDFHYALDETGRDWKRVLVPAGKGIVDFGEIKRLMELEGVRPRFTVHYDYEFPRDEERARAFATSDLLHYRSVFG